MCGYACIHCGACGKERLFPTCRTCMSCLLVVSEPVEACPRCGAPFLSPPGSVESAARNVERNPNEAVQG